MAATKPLTIAVAEVYWKEPWVTVLREKGHKVVRLDELNLENILGGPLDIFNADDCDLILGPNCARFLPGMHTFLDSFIKGARAIRYKGKKDD